MQPLKIDEETLQRPPPQPSGQVAAVSMATVSHAVVLAELTTAPLAPLGAGRHSTGPKPSLHHRNHFLSVIKALASPSLPVFVLPRPFFLHLCLGPPPPPLLPSCLPDASGLRGPPRPRRLAVRLRPRTGLTRRSVLCVEPISLFPDAQTSPLHLASVDPEGVAPRRCLFFDPQTLLQTSSSDGLHHLPPAS